MKPWHTVIIGVEPEPESARAATIGWRIAEASGSDCRLVHVVYDLVAGIATIGAPPTMRHLIARDARDRLITALRGSVPDSVLARAEILVGRPAGMLTAFASPTDLLVLGGKHHNIMTRWLAGSTVHQVARDAHGPIVVAGAVADAPRRILAAVDLSGAAEPVLAAARDMALLFGAQLGVLHVIEPIVLSFSPIGPPGFPLRQVMTDAEWENASRTTFDHAVWPLVDDPRAEKLERRGPITESIRSEAARWKADLVVVGSHGKGWTERLLMGSTTQSLLDDLPSSMLIVPVGNLAAETGTAWKQLATAEV